MAERRSGLQRRGFIRLLRSSKVSIGRRIEDLEFSLFIRMGIITFVLLAICLTAVVYIK